QAHLSVEALQHAGQQSSRPGVDPVLERNRHAPAELRACATALLGDTCGGCRRKFHQKIADLYLAIQITARNGKAATLHNEDGCEEARGAPGQEVQVEIQQALTGTNVLPFTHVQLKALAAEPNRVDADVEQDFGALLRAQSDSMFRCRDSNQLAIT